MFDRVGEAQKTAYPVGGDGVDHGIAILDSLPAEPRRWGHLLMALLVAITFASLLGSLVPTSDFRTPADRYVRSYGGDRSSYERILSSDCAALQAELDWATDSNTGAELGSVWHQTTLGYMAAAEDSLKAGGCNAEEGQPIDGGVAKVDEPAAADG
jgi:hypothetical protein